MGACAYMDVSDTVYYFSNTCGNCKVKKINNKERIMEIIQTKAYKAIDGTKFLNKKDCEAHEEKLVREKEYAQTKIEEIRKILNNPTGNEFHFLWKKECTYSSEIIELLKKYVKEHDNYCLMEIENLEHDGIKCKRIRMKRIDSK